MNLEDDFVFVEEEEEENGSENSSVSKFSGPSPLERYYQIMPKPRRKLKNPFVCAEEKEKIVEPKFDDWVVVEEKPALVTSKKSNSSISLWTKCVYESCNSLADKKALCCDCEEQRYCVLHVYLMEDGKCMDCQLEAFQGIGSFRSRKKMFSYCRGCYREDYLQKLGVLKENLRRKDGIISEAVSRTFGGKKLFLCSSCRVRTVGKYKCVLCKNDCCLKCLKAELKVDEGLIYEDCKKEQYLNVPGFACIRCVELIRRRKREGERERQRKRILFAKILLVLVLLRIDRSKSDELSLWYERYKTCRRKIEGKMLEIESQRDDATLKKELEIYLSQLAQYGKEIKNFLHQANFKLASALAQEMTAFYSEAIQYRKK